MKLGALLRSLSRQHKASPSNASQIAASPPPPRQNPTPTPTGTAFLDQVHFHASELEMHYIGSMLFAFNFAEEILNQSGAGVKVVKSLADDLGAGSYAHALADDASNSPASCGAPPGIDTSSSYSDYSSSYEEYSLKAANTGMLSMIVEDSESPHPTINDILSSPEPESPRTPLDATYDQAYSTYTSTPAKSRKHACTNNTPWSFEFSSPESPSSDPETSGSLYSEESFEARKPN